MRDHFVVTLESDDTKPEMLTRVMRAIERAVGAVLTVAFRAGDPKVTNHVHWLEDPARAEDPPADTTIEISPEGRRMYAAVDALYTGKDFAGVKLSGIKINPFNKRRYVIASVASNDSINEVFVVDEVTRGNGLVLTISEWNSWTDAAGITNLQNWELPKETQESFHAAMEHLRDVGVPIDSIAYHARRCHEKSKIDIGSTDGMVKIPYREWWILREIITVSERAARRAVEMEYAPQIIAGGDISLEGGEDLELLRQEIERIVESSKGSMVSSKYTSELIVQAMKTGVLHHMRRYIPRPEEERIFEVDGHIVVKQGDDVGHYIIKIVEDTDPRGPMPMYLERV